MPSIELHFHGNVQNVNVNTASGARSLSPRSAASSEFGMQGSGQRFTSEAQPRHRNVVRSPPSNGIIRGGAFGALFSAQHSQLDTFGFVEIRQSYAHHNQIADIVEIGQGRIQGTREDSIAANFATTQGGHISSRGRGGREGARRLNDVGFDNAGPASSLNINLNISLGGDTARSRGRKRRREDDQAQPRRRVETTFIEEGNTADGWVRRVKKRVAYE